MFSSKMWRQFQFSYPTTTAPSHLKKHHRETQSLHMGLGGKSPPFSALLIWEHRLAGQGARPSVGGGNRRAV